MKPWEKISFNDYESHMKSKEVMQLQTLNRIIENQLCKYDVESVCLFGITCGNGLEHVDIDKIKRLVGIDINKDYLDECRKRYSYLSNLELLNIDLESKDIKLDIECDLIVANLVIEYIGITAFCKHIREVHPKYVLCVLQHSSQSKLVSRSEYASAFDGLSGTTYGTPSNKLAKSMERVGYEKIYSEIIELPNHKHFERLDFSRVK